VELTTPPSSGEVKERVELYLYSPSGPSWPVLGRTLPFFNFISVIGNESGINESFKPDWKFLADLIRRERSE
jgi:hypothetical protein